MTGRIAPGEPATATDAAGDGSPDRLALSVIVTLVGGPPFLARTLDRLVPQILGRPLEVLVPCDSTVTNLEPVRRRFPAVRFLDMGRVVTDARPGTEGAAHETFDRRTAAGLCASRGDIVALLQDYGAPAPDWCEQVIAAHRLPAGVIGGGVEHEGGGPLNWAVYFLDFGRYQGPLREGPSRYLTDVNVSYKRAALERVRGLWRERYKEVTVNWALERLGVVLWQRPQMVVYQRRGPLAWRPLLVERFCWGRLFGALRVAGMPRCRRIGYALGSPLIPLLLLARMTRTVVTTRRNRLVFLRVCPQLLIITIGWCTGEFIGYLTARAAPE